MDQHLAVVCLHIQSSQSKLSLFCSLVYSQTSRCYLCIYGFIRGAGRPHSLWRGIAFKTPRSLTLLWGVWRGFRSIVLWVRVLWRGFRSLATIIIALIVCYSFLPMLPVMLLLHFTRHGFLLSCLLLSVYNNFRSNVYKEIVYSLIWKKGHHQKSHWKRNLFQRKTQNDQ